MTRQLLSILIAIGTATTTAAAPSQDEAVIHQEVDVKASPDKVYQALLDEEQFSARSGSVCKISPDEGGAFKLFGGPKGFRVIGRNVELIENRRIVQAWRVEAWPAGTYSIVRFELTARDGGTHLVFEQTGFPRSDREALSGNWPKKYWDPLRKQ